MSAQHFSQVLSTALQRQARRRLGRLLAVPRRWRVLPLVLLAAGIGAFYLFYRFSLGGSELLWQICPLLADDEAACRLWTAEGLRWLNYGSWALLAAAALTVLQNELKWRGWQRLAFRPLDGRRFDYTIDVGGLTVCEAGRTELHYRWAAVERLVLDRDFLFFFIDRGVAYYLARSAFADGGAAFFAAAQQFKEQS